MQRNKYMHGHYCSDGSPLMQHWCRRHDQLSVVPEAREVGDRAEHLRVQLVLGEQSSTHAFYAFDDKGVF